MLCLHQLWFVLSADIGHDNDNNDDNNDDDVDVDDDESGDEKLRLGAEVQQGRSAQIQAEDERPAPQEPQRHRAGRAAEPAGNVLPTGGRFKNWKDLETSGKWKPRFGGSQATKEENKEVWRGLVIFLWKQYFPIIIEER